MTTTAQRFSKFVSNIQLTENQLKDAITKHTGVRKTLHKHYYDTAFKTVTQQVEEERLYNVAEQAYIKQMLESYKTETSPLDDSYKYHTSLLVGSYGKNTAIAPPSDIDILFRIPWDQFKRYDEYTSNGQSQLLQDVKKVLQRTYPNTAIRADGQIVSVPFVSFKVEVLPAFELTDGRFFYPDTHGGGSWKTTAPKDEMKYLSDSNKNTNGNTIRLIKMLKAWKRNCNVSIKSLTLELRTVNFLRNWEYADKSYTYYDWMIRDFFRSLLNYVNGTCQIPGIDEKLNYGNAWESNVKTALDHAEKACQYESQNNDTLATMEWKKIFGDRFNF